MHNLFTAIVQKETDWPPRAIGPTDKQNVEQGGSEASIGVSPKDPGRDTGDTGHCMANRRRTAIASILSEYLILVCWIIRTPVLNSISKICFTLIVY